MHHRYRRGVFLLCRLRFPFRRCLIAERNKSITPFLRLGVIDSYLKAEDVPLLVGETVQKDQGGSCWQHIAIVDGIAKTIPTAHVISSKGCPQRGDGLHFIAESYRTMGKRYANMMLS